MKTLSLWCALSWLALCACTGGTTTTALPVINIAAAMDAATSFTVADMGCELVFVPLETTDECLVGRFAQTAIAQNKLFLPSKKLLVFDATTGKFLNHIGGVGQGPEEYARIAAFYVDQTNGTVYVNSGSIESMQKYTSGGRHLAKWKSGVPAASSSMFGMMQPMLIDKDTITMSFPDYADSIVRLDGITGQVISTIPSEVSTVPFEVGDIQSIRVTKSNSGSLSGNFFQLTLKNERQRKYALNDASLWRFEGQNMLKNNFVDTIYTLQEHALQPRIVLNLGKYHWPFTKRYNLEGTNDYAYPNIFFENSEWIYFTLYTHFYDANPKPWMGIYNKQTGETRMMESEIIKDEATGLSFPIAGITSDGEFYGIVQAATLIDLQEAQPIAGLKPLGEDDNPVLVLLRKSRSVRNNAIRLD